MMETAQLPAYRKSMVLQKAFTALVLSKLESSGLIDAGSMTIKLRRGTGLDDQFRERSGLQNVPIQEIIGKEFTEPKNGIADSTALGSPSPMYCFAGDPSVPSAKVVVEYEMPFCDVHAAFMFEEELATPGESGTYGPNSEYFEWEHECVCNLVDKKAKIVYADSSQS
jgi:hypothetical protein